MTPHMLSCFLTFLTFLYVDWEARNCVPAGTIQQALLSGGENSPSLKYRRGELTSAEFLQELGQQCFEIVSRLPLLSLYFLTAGKQDPTMWRFREERGAFKINPLIEGSGITIHLPLLSDPGRLFTAFSILVPRQDGQLHLPSLPPASSCIFHNFFSFNTCLE